MSGGEQQMLTVARTLMGNPYLVLLDEPSEGVAPLIVEEMARMIVALKKEGVSVLLSEQNLHFARLVSDRAVVLEKGEVKFVGTMDALMSDEALLRTPPERLTPWRPAPPDASPASTSAAPSPT